MAPAPMAGCTMRRQHAEQRQVIERLGRFLLARQVMAVDVGDFVAEHARHLVVVARPDQQPGVDVDVAAGHGKRIDARIADDGEVVGERLIAEARDDLLPDAVDVAVDLDVVMSGSCACAASANFLPSSCSSVAEIAAPACGQSSATARISVGHCRAASRP